MRLADILIDAAYACIPTGLYLVGERRKLGWSVGLVGQLLMVGYGIASRHLWMVLMPAVCAAMQIRHLILWRHESWGKLKPPNKSAKKSEGDEPEVQALQQPICRSIGYQTTRPRQRPTS